MKRLWHYKNIKKRFLARSETIIYAILILVAWSTLIGLVLFEIQEKESIGIFVSILLLPWGITLPLAYNSMIFETNYIIYKKNLFSRKYKIHYDCLKKIYIDYTGCTISYYKGAKPRIVLFFDNGYKIETNIRYGILWNLIKNKPKQCAVKIVLPVYSLCPENHRELLKDYLTQKQKNKIESLIFQKKEKYNKRTKK